MNATVETTDDIFKQRDISEPVICQEEVVDEEETPTWLKYLPKNSLKNDMNGSISNENLEDRLETRELRSRRNRKVTSCNIFSETHQRNKEATKINSNKLKLKAANVKRSKVSKVNNANKRKNRIGKFVPVPEYSIYSDRKTTNITELNALMTFSKITK